MRIVFLVDQYYQMVFPSNYSILTVTLMWTIFYVAPLCLVEKVLQS